MRRRRVKRQQAFRLPEELIARLDRYAEQLRRAAPGMEITRADAVRLLLARALDEEEHRVPKGLALALRLRRGAPR